MTAHFISKTDRLGSETGHFTSNSDRLSSETVAIIGGTGTLGRLVADELRSRGHQVRILGRSAPGHRVDLTTGEGLDAALKGCDVVIDASNNSSRRAREVLVDGARRLLAAEQAAAVDHHVAVSIVGCEQVPFSYFQVKAEQERVVEQGLVPWTVVRATQFHELAAGTLAMAARRRILPVPRARLQTVAAADVAAVVADVAMNPPQRGRVEVAGPEITDARDLARTWRSATGSRSVLLPVAVPGRLGRALRSGALTTERPDVRGAVPFAAWLAQHR
jgi:uncharacterized protein YbjT (DUF2867 family)